MIFCLLITIICIFQIINSQSSIATVAPTWMSSDYFRAGQYQIVSTHLQPADPPATYTFNFATSFNNTPNVAYGIKQYRGHDTFWEENYQCKRVGILDTTQFTVQFIILVPTQIYYVSVAYVAIDGTFPHHIRSFQNKPIDWGSALTNINGAATSTRVYVNTMNYPALCIAQGYTISDLPAPLLNVKILMYQTSAFFEEHTMSKPVDYSVTYTVLDAQNFDLTVTIHNFVKINSMQFSMLVFNTEQIVSTNKYEAIFGSVSVNAPGGTFTSGYNVQNSFVMGIFTLKSSSAGCSIQYDWTILSINPLTIQINLPLPLGVAMATCSLTQATSVYFYLRLWYCPTPFNYFNLTTELCQNMCDMGFYENLTDYICYPCNTYISNCVDCSSYNTCTLCDSQYVVDSNACNQCQGGNAIADAYLFKIKKIIKNVQANGLQFKFDIQQIILQQLLGISLTSNTIVSVNESFLIFKQALMNDDSSTISIIFQYTQTVHQKYIELIFRPAITQLNGCVLMDTFQIIPNNNVPAVYFQPQEYFNRQNTKNLIKVIQISTFVIAIASVLPAKIIGIQLSGVLQLWFFSLAQQNNINLLISPLMQMKQVNGFNMNFNQNEPQMPDRIQTLNYKQDFVNNCNVMIFIILTLILIGVTMYGVSRVSSQKLPNLNKVSKHILKEFLLTFILFNSLNISFSMTLQFYYSELTDQDYAISIILSIVSIILIICILLALSFTSQNQFGQFKNKFKQDFASRNYFIFTIIYRFALGFYIALMNQYEISTMIIIAFSIVFLMYNLINLPFKDFYQNYRASLCHITFLVILAVSMYYRNMKSQDNVQQVSRINAPIYLQFFMIILCILLSGAVLIYEFYLFIKRIISKCKQKKAQQPSPRKLTKGRVQNTAKYKSNQIKNENNKSQNNLNQFDSLNQIIQQVKEDNFVYIQQENN